MNTAKIAALMRQPSTVVGISTLVGTLTAVLTAQLTWQNAVPAIAGSVAAIALPDNPRAQVAIKDAAAAVMMVDQTVTHSAKEAAVISATKTASIVVILLTGSFALSAYAIQPAAQARAMAEQRNIYALVANSDVPTQAVESVIVADQVAREAR